MPRCLPSSPTASPGRARRSPSPSGRASVLSSGRSIRLRRPAKCSGSAAAELAAGRLRRCLDSRHSCYSRLRCRATRLPRDQEEGMKQHMKRSTADIVREYGPFPGAERVNGVTYDGRQVWFATGDKLRSFDPESGDPLRSIDVAAHAGTAYDGEHLYQIAEDRIQKIDPNS